MTKYLPLGKLPSGMLEKLLIKYRTVLDDRLIMGPMIGEDVAVINDGDKYIVSKTDPITFATDEIGWYAVNINANDIATSGARPKWFQATILLPEKKTTEELIDKIMNSMASACRELDVSITGGHTEITHGLDRPIVIGSMLGEVSMDKLVLATGAKKGDYVILTKGIVIEGASIIAKDTLKNSSLKQ